MHERLNVLERETVKAYVRKVEKNREEVHHFKEQNEAQYKMIVALKRDNDRLID